MKSRVLIIDNCFTHLELITLARTKLVGRNIDLVIFDDLTTSQNFITEPSNKKGSQGPRNRWGQMK